MRLKSLLVVLYILFGSAVYGNPVPWGAMYTPNEFMARYGMKGVVKYYRGERGARRLVEDLQYAEREECFIIATLGSPNPKVYLRNGHIDLDAVRKELSPFFKIADRIQPFALNGILWGIRFMDEPHNPRGMPRGFSVSPEELGRVFRLIKSYFKGMKVGSTAPASYMVKVPNADFAIGQYNHSHPPGEEGFLEFFKKEAKIAHGNGLKYVASVNSNMNSIDNRTFWRDYLKLCSLEGIDFITSWQWSHGRYPYPSFERRINDPSVRDIVREIPSRCGWK